MKAVVFAYHDIGCAGMESLIRNGIEILAVFTHRDDPNENRWFGSPAEMSALQGIPVYAPENVNHPIWIEKIKVLKPDIFFSFHYKNMIKKEVLDLAPMGALNLHESLLPRYRGPCPLNWVLVHGEKETGVTLHYMTPKPENGDIVGQKTVPISGEDTAQSLMGKLVASSHLLLDELLPKFIKGMAPRIPQDNKNATYFGDRKKEDGLIDWSRTATEIRNLIRAETHPYPGAYTFFGERKFFVWKASVKEVKGKELPGTILSVHPLTVACGKNSLVLDFIQEKDGLYMSGIQMAEEQGWIEKMRLGNQSRHSLFQKHPTRVLILGVNGFIGNALSEHLLDSGGYEVHGMDLHNDKISRLIERKGFHFEEGDISINREWIEYHVRKCDVILPLVAIATPKEYIRNPLKVFSLDFEENLRIVRHCVRYGKRIIFPSTSEVYGMCQDGEFDEDKSNLVLGPIRMQRWIYSCSKQLLDRVIWAYGKHENLKFTLFRPFNWIGPRLDSLDSARIGSSRVITQLILNLVEGTPILLVDGGRQKRCFTDVKDGVECLYRIIENKGGKADQQIFNVGNPDNNLSIRELAEVMVAKFEKHPLRSYFPAFCGMKEVESLQYYGKGGYQDVEFRKPSIQKAQAFLDWTPKVGFETSLDETLDFFLRETVGRIQAVREKTVSSLCNPHKIME